jgi:hypothetical protein
MIKRFQDSEPASLDAVEAPDPRYSASLELVFERAVGMAILDVEAANSNHRLSLRLPT